MAMKTGIDDGKYDKEPRNPLLRMLRLPMLNRNMLRLMLNGRLPPPRYGNLPMLRRLVAYDEWVDEDDRRLLRRYIADQDLSDLTSNNEASSLCSSCRTIDLDSTLSSACSRSLNNRKVEETGGCVLCRILSKVSNEHKMDEMNKPLLEARPFIRVCSVPGDPGPLKSVRPGLPVFLESKNPGYFRLLKGWLRLCDDGECGRYLGCGSTPKTLPTRLIDLGDGSDIVKLIEISPATKTEEIRYVALSHCWGTQEEETQEKKKPKGQKPEWCTTSKNKGDRTKGFSVGALPETFRDAITVTGKMGIKYLWIDSLCIIQDDDNDWEKEAKRMKEVFKNAYFTIAATSAEDSTKGLFTRPVEEYATVHTSHGRVYIYTPIDDFPEHVEKGVLNGRAWVLQERLLSRRTIHFTNRQTYWECGGGVRSETLTYMRNESYLTRSDPEYPESIGRCLTATQIELFQKLFEEYSGLRLTKSTDRPTAIDSLSRELGKVLGTEVRYGIFKDRPFLHRSLLWRSQSPTTPIPISLPSWSWMAYEGQIEYPQLPELEWDTAVRIGEDKASNTASNSKSYVMEARVMRVQDCTEDDGVDLKFDQEKAPGEVRCAIIGRGTEGVDGTRKYHVLVVKESSERGLWERVGMGWIQERLIMFDDQILAQIA